MADDNIVACIALPKIPEIPSITLLGGAELKGFVDFSQGMPTDCKVTFNLLLQLSPLLASMACLFKILNVIGKLQDFANAATDPINKLPGAVPDLVQAIDELKDCIPALAFAQVFIMLKGILSLIINFLLCFISQLESIVNIQISIDLGAAEGNPVLLTALTCALDNAQTSMDNLMLSLQPIQPILMVVTMVAGIVGESISLPDLSSISVGTDHIQAITSLREAITSMQQVIDTLPE
jgi:hypothetical protein